MVAATPLNPSAVSHDEEDDDGRHDDLPKSLIIPITSTTPSGTPDPHKFIEIFPEEVPTIAPPILIRVLRDENAPLSIWADAALMYVQRKKEREGAEILTAACEMEAQCGNRDHRVRVLASAGIAHLTQANRHGKTSAAGKLEKDPTGADATPAQRAASDHNEELRSMADNRFTHAGKVDQLFPMTWVGRGMLNLSVGRVDQARFFFETTLKQCGQVLPALLGMAAVRFAESDFKGAQELYGRAMRLFPEKSGAATRVGFGLASYRLGQVDRATAAFKRAHALDPENVEAMVGSAILEMSSLDEASKDFRSKTENAIKMISTANLVDHSNAMVQNHLANHYFWKWTPVPGTVNVENGSVVVKGSQPIGLDSGERIRIGLEFETCVAEDDEEEGGGGGREEANVMFRMKDAWKGKSEDGLKLWKKDYDRVVALAKGAYNSTTVQEMQAESLFLLARVFHVRDDMENALKFYDRACKLAPDLSPARFGLAQTLVWEEQYAEAAAHLRLVLGTSSGATDALAALGLLEVKSGKDRREGLGYLRKAIDLDPLNPDLVLLEALALQQQENTYNQSLEKYRKAVGLMEMTGTKVPAEVLTNIGVLCHETKKYDDALEVYGRALRALDKDGTAGESSLEEVGAEVLRIRHKDNGLFWNYVDAGLMLIKPMREKGDVALQLVGAKGKNVASLPVKVGDHVRLGHDFETEIVNIISSGDEGSGITLRIKEAFVPPPKESKEGTDEMDTEDGDKSEKEEQHVPLFVKRSNKRLLKSPLAVSITFNLARLHESAGRILAAVELHKAIVCRHPSYVNSYLRLACIARDCGSLKDCSEWLKSAVAVSPGNAEVLTLVGNLHLSLCDWAPAQSVFDQLLTQKVPNVEAYSMLSLGNIYFHNLKTPRKYTKHLYYAADFYKRILQKDKANAYAANGLGTILAEKGELRRAKEAFNRVREVSGDTILDALLNLGHIYLAQKRHPEALQMYQSYMMRTRGGGASRAGGAAPVTSKSRDDDEAEVLLYVAFAYFDWARQTELFNNQKAAPADDRYKKCIEYIELAMKKSRKENIAFRYNWCMAKLQAANCVLQKLTRNIRRTAQEVQEALDGLEESLPIVQTLVQWKTEGKRIPIKQSMLNDFVSHCRANIESAKSHLSEELKRESEAREIRELQRIEAEAQKKEREMEIAIQRQKEAEAQEQRERKARAKMDKVSSLVVNWEQEAEAKKTASEKKKEKGPGEAPPGGVDEEDGIFDDDVNLPARADTSALFDDSSDEEEKDQDAAVNNTAKESTGRDEAAGEEGQQAEEERKPEVEATEKDLFGSSSEEEMESDEELVPQNKRGNDEKSSGGDDEEGNATKRRRVMAEDED